jgi:hypothetical protein
MTGWNIFVQIEIQQRQACWYVKGCTAYATNGMVPIRIPYRAFSTRRVCVRTMKHMAREQLMLTYPYRERALGWQLLLWPPVQPISGSEPIKRTSRGSAQSFLEGSLVKA